MKDEKQDKRKLCIVATVSENQRYMRVAIDHAEIARQNGDVPVGAVIVHEGRLIAKAYNQRHQLNDPTAHAEIIALTQAAEAVGSWRLEGCTIYVTLEPCAMCAGALVNARVRRLVFGCRDPRFGAVRSKYRIADNGELNHRIEVVEGILAEECSQLLSDFFLKLRRRGQDTLKF